MVEGTPDLPAVEGGGGAVARETGGGEQSEHFPQKLINFVFLRQFDSLPWAASSFSLFSSSISALLRTIGAFFLVLLGCLLPFWRRYSFCSVLGLVTCSKVNSSMIIVPLFYQSLKMHFWPHTHARKFRSAPYWFC